MLEQAWSYGRMKIGTVKDQDHYVSAVKVQYRNSYSVKSIDTVQDQ